MVETQPIAAPAARITTENAAIQIHDRQPLPQQAMELAQWRKHDPSNYDFAASLIQRSLVAAMETMSARYGTDWMSRRRWWSRDLASGIATELKQNGCQFPLLYTEPSRSQLPIRGRSLEMEDIAELGYDVSNLTNADLARFADALSGHGDIKTIAARAEFQLAPLVTAELLKANGIDCLTMTDHDLLKFSAAVHQQMAGFTPSDFPQDFTIAIRSVAKSRTG